jgi:hypothetical protein
VLERQWQHARSRALSTAKKRALRAEAEKLKTQLLRAGEWACRKDEHAMNELARIREGTGLADTIQDLFDLSDFWIKHSMQMIFTKITANDLARAQTMAMLLRDTAGEEGASSDAATALALRNRCFWAADALAREVREGGRYAFDDQPKIAAAFVSRYRSDAVRRHRQRKAQPPLPAPPPPLPRAMRPNDPPPRDLAD